MTPKRLFLLVCLVIVPSQTFAETLEIVPRSDIRWDNWRFVNRKELVGHFSGVHFTPDGLRGWIVGDRGKILSTTDGGITWIRRNSGTEMTLVDVESVKSGRIVWAVGIEATVVVSTDYGATWSRRSDDLAGWLDAVHVSADGRRAWVVGMAGDIYATTDSGRTWTKQYSGQRRNAHRPPWLFDIHFSRDNQHGWAVGEKGLILATIDGGVTWFQQYSGTKYSLFGIDFSPDGRHGWAVGIEIHATTNGGSSWRRQPYDRSRLLNDVHVSADGRRIWAVGEWSTIVSSDDGGKTWKDHSIYIRGNLYGVSVSEDGKIGWAVGGDNAVATIDGKNDMPIVTSFSATSRADSAVDLSIAVDDRDGSFAGLEDLAVCLAATTPYHCYYLDVQGAYPEKKTYTITWRPGREDNDFVRSGDTVIFRVGLSDGYGVITHETKPWTYRH